MRHTSEPPRRGVEDGRDAQRPFSLSIPHKSHKKGVNLVQKSLERYVLQKVVISGNHVEFYKYSIPVRCEFEKGISLYPCKEGTGEKREDNLSRARQNVRRVIWCNLTPHTKFLTLTCTDTCLDLKVFMRHMQTFFQAMKRNGYELRYLYVLERQLERGEKEGNAGSWHAHIIVFNDEKIPLDVLKKCWKYGRSEIKILHGLRVKDNEKIRDIGAYVCKYITKDSVLELGARSYRCSKGLKRPLEIDLKADGAPEFGFFVDKEDLFNETVVDLFSKAEFNYQDTKIVRLNYEQDSYQIIEYTQGIIKTKDNGEYVVLCDE